MGSHGKGLFCLLFVLMTLGCNPLDSKKFDSSSLGNQEHLIANGVDPFAASGGESTLFIKHYANPVFDVRKSSIPAWRRIHAANVSVLPPSESGTNTWRMFMRGSGEINGYHDTIGLFTQPVSSFNPFGPWQEFAGNPVIRNGASGYDEKHLLDGSVLMGPNNTLYLYYLGVTNDPARYSLNGAYSMDGGVTFTKFANNPLSTSFGPNDVVFHNGNYYTYFAKTNSSGQFEIYLSISAQPNQLSTNHIKVLPAGQTGAFDSKSVMGVKIFRVPGDPKWFMIYQTSDRFLDYPDRFHVAYSRDLKTWRKVYHPLPALVRGQLGKWDQGAIWTGSVFDYNGRLYTYYEGWGSFTNDYNRDELYYLGGNSRVGIASVDISQFLAWAHAYNPDGTVPRQPTGYTGLVSSNGTVSGWAYDPDYSFRSIRVHYYIDGKIIGGLTANIYRPDVNQAKNITGNHGFSINIPSTYFDGKSHRLRVVAVDTYGSSPNKLIGDRTFTLGGPQGSIGVVDGLDSNGRVWGWAFDQDNTSTSVSVQFYVDEVLKGSTPANQSRPDVNTAYSISGNHGFSFQLPSSVLNGVPHILKVYALDSQGFSPKKLIGTRSFTIGTPSVPLISNGPFKWNDGPQGYGAIYGSSNGSYCWIGHELVYMLMYNQLIPSSLRQISGPIANSYTGSCPIPQKMPGVGCFRSTVSGYTPATGYYYTNGAGAWCHFGGGYSEYVNRCGSGKPSSLLNGTGTIRIDELADLIVRNPNPGRCNY
ncbi:MAG: hypothetical protein H6624_01280 [Bdellovibrionaceae bacterium]|nr:hypothetical protein [Bdellovibrionales bacterium]MCB9082941.1 hypothetical protein [Pseudobdellovibrionaceae bacterium]